MDLVDEEDRVRIVLQRLQDRLQALFEITPVLGPGQQGAHVQRVDIGVGEDFRHFALDHLARQTFGDRRLADAGFADQQRIVLAPPAQRLDDAFQFLVAADQRIDLALQRQRVEVDRVLLERAGIGFFAFGFDFAFRCGLLLRHLADAVGNVIDHVEPGDALLLQEIHRVRILLAVDGDQHVGAIHFLLAGRLHVQDGTLDHALETERRLGVDIVLATDHWRVFVDEIGQILA